MVVELRSAQAFCGRYLEDTYGEIVCEHLKAVQCNGQGNFKEAYQSEKNSTLKFLELYRSETNWLLPVFMKMVTNMRVLATRADDVTESDVCLKDCERNLKTGFSVSQNDRASLDVSKKWGALHAVTNLLQIYFKLNLLNMSTPMINAVNSKQFPPLAQFPKSQTVVYKYYSGRISLFKDDYANADEDLTYAFENSAPQHVKNKRLVLQYLVPTKMILGHFPPPQLLDQYSLPQFKALSAAVRKGNLLAFEKSLDENQEYFVQKGIYLILEQLKMRAYRNLFRRIRTVLSTERLFFSRFHPTLVKLGVDMDHDEMECILCNLIYKKYMKGYVAHGKALVLAKTDCFPQTINLS